MKNSTDVRLNVYVSQDCHNRLKTWARGRGQTIQGAVSVLVSAAVAEVELPTAEPAPVKSIYEQSFGVPQPVVEEEPEEPWRPGEEFNMLLQSGASIPQAIAKVRMLCGKEGIVGWNPPRTLHPDFVAQYRKWAVGMGRDADEDLKSLELAQ